MHMYKMNKMTEFNSADYEGFTLKRGFWYGRNMRGQAIATSGWQAYGSLYIYTRTERGWKGAWVDPEKYGFEVEAEDEAM